jgi:acyl transferase domain-containing protein
LKRLDRALEDGDSIRAVIRASGVNSDGWTQGVTMPSSEAQAALIKYVYTSHGLDYESTQYVEAHVSCIKKMRTSTIIKSELTDV